MRSTKQAACYALVASLLATGACGEAGGTAQPDSGTDAFDDGDVTPDAGGREGGDATDQDVAALNGCADDAFLDQTAPDAGRLIMFPTSAAAAPYSPPCIVVKRHQSVTFAGSFADHPLTAAGGDTPNLISNVEIDGGTGKVDFSFSGLFGFECRNHSSLMRGAIRVVP